MIAHGPPADMVDEALVRKLYGIDADILRTLSDASPVVVPRSRPRNG